MVAQLKIIVGLGNPGSKYDGTRHNLGFWVVDEFSKVFNGYWSEEKKYNSLVSKVKIQNVDVLLIKPLTFMNLSGDSVVPALKFSGINKDLSNLIVAYDDLDFDSGVVKLKFGGSAGGHNGLSDIISKIGSDKFYRIRVGIGHPRNSKYPQMDVKNWVLAKPEADEQFKLVEAAKFSVQALEKLIVASEEDARDFIAKRKG